MVVVFIFFVVLAVVVYVAFSKRDQVGSESERSGTAQRVGDQVRSESEKSGTAQSVPREYSSKHVLVCRTC